MQHPTYSKLGVRLIVLSLVFVLVMLHQQFFRTPSFMVALRNLDQQYFSNIGWPLESNRQDPLSSENAPLIPNIIHFVRLVDEPSKDSTLHFTFRLFVAIYSAHYYMQPETIYIHTNVPEHLILPSNTNFYGRAINKLPNIKYNYHYAPNQTTTGITIDNLPHRSDFVRTDVLEKFGGIYLDDDVYLLRELHTLRHIGYQNVVGRQINGKNCNAVIMATPGNRMISAYNALQNTIYDGGWETHSVFLLTSLAREFASVGNHVMIVPQDTFFPLSWEKGDLETLYQVHPDAGELETNNRSIKNQTEFISNFHLWPPESWRHDWRLSYVLHGWTSSIKNNFDGNENTPELFDEYKGISLDYILARNSNFARAVYPAVKDALDSGFLDEFMDD